jgi:hypothetical protein
VIQLEDGQIDPELPVLVAMGKFLDIRSWSFLAPRIIRFWPIYCGTLNNSLEGLDFIG